jgi:hypothetical protein
MAKTLLRFHLSTLLLLCICAGAILGLYLDRNILRLEASKPEESMLGPPGIGVGTD